MNDLIKLIYETYFSVQPQDRQSAKWFIKPQLWEDIRQLKSGNNVSMVVPMLNEDRYFLIGLPVHLDEHADWIDLRS
jgi:HK97 family phage major capsid protein